jgi:hypothetical protein
VVAATDPGVSVRDGEDRFDFLLGEEREDRSLEPFLRDRQDPRDQVGVFGVLERGLSAVDDYPQWTGRWIRIPLQGRRLAL